ncbi:MAG: feuC 2 [Lacrimispora sp.]|jgi:iron complex transport system permease protein|nr:feuC 2 [Lacrimispora sp.]
MGSQTLKKYLQKTAVYHAIVVISCIALLILSSMISISTGYSRLSFSDTIRIVSGQGSTHENLILFSFRLPRIALSILVGSGLAVSGCLLQGITRNPLADPSLMGINSGAGLMVTVFVLFGGRNSTLSILTLPVLALAGAAGAAAIVYFFAYKKENGFMPGRMIMTGIAVQAGLSALTTLLVLKLDDTQYSFVSSWQIGSIWGANWEFVFSLLPWLCMLLPLAFIRARTLDVIGLGEDVAGGLGVAVNKEQKWMLFIAVALAGACVSVSGSISFVGLMAPHLTRKLVGPRHSVALPVCALTGAILVSAADTIARIVIQPSSLPTGVVVSVIGAPYFIFLLVKREKEKR